MDYISREEAIQELEFICENKILSKEGTYALCIALDEMKSNSRPKGEWEASTNGTDYRVCSNCLYERHAGTKYNYCPICGADMRGEE